MRKIEIRVLRKYAMDKVLRVAIYHLFFDSSNRPKKTPRHESSIQLMLEERYTPSQVKNALTIMEESGILQSFKYNVPNVGDARFYFPVKLPVRYVEEKLLNKIEKAAYWISRYSDIKTVTMLGDHLHYLVKNELRVQGFEILQEKHVKSYREKEWSRSKHTLDIIAEHKRRRLTIGVEIKNMLTQTPKSEIVTKLDMCRTLGVFPVFACRRQETHRDIIQQDGGFLWQFKKQLYPFGQESLVEELQKRFNFPVEVKGELPSESISSFQAWIKKFNKK